MNVISKKSISIDYEQWAEFKEIECKSYLKGFRDRVKKYYSNYHKNNSDVFSYMQPIKIWSFFVNNKSYDLFCRSCSDKDEFQYEILQLTDDEISNLEDMPSEFKKDYFNNILNRDDCIELKESFFNKLQNRRENWDYFSSQAYQQGSRDADLYYNISKIKLLHSSENATFSVINKDKIIKKIADDNFAYELEEAINAYNYELYLASACVAVVCIETILELAIRKKLGIQPKQTYIYALAKILLDNDIIDGKMFNRIMAINKIRHGVAHTTTGKAQKWDVEQIFVIIQMLANTLFD